MERVYPKHLYEPIRVEIAVSYVRHELRKYLGSLRGKKAWSKIDKDVAGWFDKAPFLYPVRDFWNGVHGIMMGFKLYIGLLNFITAENVIWSKEEIGLKRLTFGTLNEVLAKRTKETQIKKVQEVCGDLNSKERLADLEKVASFYKLSERREEHPIIVIQKKIGDEDKLVIYDGNGRATRALLEGRSKIQAFVSRFKDKGRRPVNYWLSTAFLMELVYFARDAWQAKDERVYRHYVEVGRHVLRESRSESGVYELKNRSMPHKKFLEVLLKDLGI